MASTVNKKLQAQVFFLSPSAINTVLIKGKVMQSTCTPYKLRVLILAFVTEKCSFFTVIIGE